MAATPSNFRHKKKTYFHSPENYITWQYGSQDIYHLIFQKENMKIFLENITSFSFSHLLSYNHIRMALEAGKDVICTQPLMTSLEDTNNFLALKEKSGRHVFIGQSSHYFEPTNQQRKDFEA